MPQDKELETALFHRLNAKKCAVFLISPYGLPMAAIWLLGKVQDLKFAIQDLVYG